MSRLALYGGEPVRKTMLPYGHQWVDEDDIQAVVRVLRGEWLTQGPTVEEFERKVAEYCGARYAVAMSSGTAALHAACLAAGIGAGDEAITTPLTFAATANAVVYCGGRPVFADIRPDTLTIDPQEIERRITPRTKAILPVDFAGLPADMDAIMAIARRHGLMVIEDAAHALGARYKGRRVGTLADMTVFSFHPVKHITTGEGGMVVTDHAELYERLRRIRHHGIVRKEAFEPGRNGRRLDQDAQPTGGVGQPSSPRTQAWYYEIPELGHNFRLTDVQAALGISQMGKLDKFLARRRAIAAYYRSALSGLPITPPPEPEGYESAYHIYVVQCGREGFTVDRTLVFNALRAEGIGVQVHYVPVHLHPFYRARFGHRPGDYPNTEAYYERALTLPLFPRMTDADVKDVVTAVHKVFNELAERNSFLDGSAKNVVGV